MKIDAVTIGAEVAVIDPRHTHELPRHAEVTAVESVAVPAWDRLGNRTSRSVRQVRVKFLDEPTFPGNSFDTDVRTAKKGSNRLIEARFIEPWKNVSKHVLATIDYRKRSGEFKDAYEKRIRDLLPKGRKNDHFYVTVYGGQNGTRMYADASLSDRILDILLDLAEKGAAK